MLFLLIFVVTFVKGTRDVWTNIRNKELKGLLSALLAGMAGMLACAYGNEMLQTLPNGPILYICMAFIFMGPKFDREISDGTT